ncbi:rhomboid family intramembrane serine protease [Bacillus sp. HMF5848]|uniref:rhomboid family intramembrane serine protease n=1 Tax=Bacillus sp. HMF5848 TaxID=2495421 RepID=UPI000F7AB7F6|nr:rhomboid family intramembrane serine protease [Bacillus sp. HMF5848]RSK25661.1 rhomboid family intramembrane serine protease [Bacillus sp. HMF5848]
MFIRTENFSTFIRWYPLVTAIVAVHAVLWLLTAFPLPLSVILFEKGAGYNFWIAEGEYWRLVTPIFFHAGFMHALFNSFSIVLFGPALERFLGKTKFLSAYLIAGVFGNIATYLFQPLQYVHVGSSGAIFGLFGIYVFMALFRKDLMSETNSQTILSIVVIGLIMTFLQSNINVAAHIFGLLAGGILAPFVLPKPRTRDTMFVR